MKKQNKKSIEESLLAQLEKKGLKTPAFIDLVADYMAQYDLKEKLRRDISKRGVTIETPNSSGRMIVKENPSVKSFLMANKQMLQLLEKMDLVPGKTIPDEGAGDEDL